MATMTTSMTSAIPSTSSNATSGEGGLRAASGIERPTTSSTTSGKTAPVVVAYRPAAKTKKGGITRAMTANVGGKSVEDMKDELLQLRKSLASISDENNLLKAKVRRTEDENVKKNEELRRFLTEKNSGANLTINNLKQKVIKLELALKEKDQMLRKCQADVQSTKIKEMKIQIDTYQREIQRLKNQNQKKNNNNNNNDNKINQEKSISDLSAVNKELMEENKELKKELTRIMENEKTKSIDGDYEKMDNERLLEQISELQRFRQESENQQNEIVAKADAERAGLECQVMHLQQQIYYYQNLLASKENEVKSLRLYFNNQNGSPNNAVYANSLYLQQGMSQSNCSEMGAYRASSASLYRGHKRMQEPFVMSSIVRKVPVKTNDVKKTTANTATNKKSLVVKPKNVPRNFSTNSFQLQGSLNSCSECNHPHIHSQHGPFKNLQEPVIIMSTTVRKIPVNNNEVKSSKGSVGAIATSPRKNENFANDLESAKPTSEGQLTKMLNCCDGQRRPLSAESSFKTIQSTISNTSTLSSEKEFSKINSSGTDPWIVQSSVRKVPAEDNLEKSDVTNSTNASSSKKPTTYRVMLKTPEEPESSEVKSKAGGDSSREVDGETLQNFRENVAAKRIQRRWKHYQNEMMFKERTKKLNNIKENRAARTIQESWKKHLADAEELKVESQIEDINDEEMPEDYDDDDDVVC